MQLPSRDPSGQRRTLLAILGMAAIVGGGMVAAGALTDRPATVKPATGTAHAMALAGAKPARD
ncbi:MAG: hypothetical protein U9R77_04725 [Pseudomonadota bacterium]|uniref:hypothetical protein n=1 Tax=Sphingobium naphthae TaxID=1886786 RepID=UPI002B19BC2D|nr:hypothetical protein [Pseudomonadota bacterium]